MYKVHNNASTSVFFTKYSHVRASNNMRWQGNVVRLRGNRNAKGILMGKPERKKLILRFKLTGENHMKIDLQGRKWSAYYIYPAQDTDT